MTQQVISYYPVHLPTQNTFQNVTIPQQWGFTSNSSEIQPSIKSAINSSLSSSSSNSWPPSTPSGLTYQSLAVCASCTNKTMCTEEGLDSQKEDYLRMKAWLPRGPSKDPHLPIINTFYIVSRPDNQEPQAGECALYWCLKTYPIRVDDNSTLIVIQSPSYNRSNNGSDVYNIGPANADQKPFWVDVSSSKQISDWMSRQLTGGYGDEKGPEHTRPQPRGKDSEHCGWNPDLKNVPNTASDAIVALGNSSSGSIENKFCDIAAALTDQIQSSPRPDEPTTFIGKAKVVRTSQTTITTNLVIHVQWAWLALPIHLVVLALIFQIITMVRTSRRKTAIWKSSTLALFFHGRGVREGVHSTGGAGMDDMAVMEDLAGRMKVRLENDGRDWCLTEERRRVV